MTSREIVIERQMFLQEAFLQSLKWGGTMNPGIPLHDFLSHISDLPATIFARERELSISLPVVKLILNRIPTERRIAFVTGNVEEDTETEPITYHPEDYYAIITRGSQMNPIYSIDIYTNRTKREIGKIQKTLRGKQTKMKIPRRYKALSTNIKWARAFTPMPRAS